MEGLVVTVGIGLAVVAGHALAPALRRPVPLAQALLGFFITSILRLEHLDLPPEAVLLLFLPALLFWESLTTSISAFLRDFCVIAITSTVFIVATTFAVGAMAWAVGIPWAVALVLGAAVAPPDATAARALAKGLPRRQFMLLKAESLVNGGTALVVYGIAVGLALGGTYTAWDITWKTVLAFGGGILVGGFVAAISYPVMSRMNDPITINLALIVTPYAAYLAAEVLEASGVLAVVVTGLLMAHVSNRITTPVSRAQAEQVWPLATSLLNSALFLLIGIETQVLVSRFSLGQFLVLTGIALAVVATLVVSRLVLLQLIAIIIRTLDRRPAQRAKRMSHRARIAGAASAFRGAVSLVIALSIPRTLDDGVTPFPYRDEVVLIIALAILIGMAIQWELLPRLIAWAARGTCSEDQDEVELSEEQRVNEAYQLVLTALRPELPVLAEQAQVPARVTRQMLEGMDDLSAHFNDDPNSLTPEQAATYRAMETMHNAIYTRKRAILDSLMRTGQISQETAQIVRTRMDLEEIRRERYMPYE